MGPKHARVCPQADRRCQCICGPVPGSRLHPVEELMLPRGWDGAGEEEPAHSAAAAAARSLQSCRTLCNPIDSRLPHPWDSPGKKTGVGCHFLLQCRKVKSESEVAHSCPTLSDPMDCSLPGSSIHGIFQARVLEWGAIAFSTQCRAAISISKTVSLPPRIL